MMHDVPQAGLTLLAVAGPVERRVRPRRRDAARAAPKPGGQMARVETGAVRAEREERGEPELILVAERRETTKAG